MQGDISRRDLARWALFGAGAAPIAAMVAACTEGDKARTANARPRGSTTTSSSPATTSTAPATTAPGSTLPTDPDVPWWLQGNYAPVMDEVTSTELVVRGALPPDLSGLYVKNGSNPPRSDSPHWFFGDGMVHGVSLSAGSASWYRNRYVRTQPYVAGVGFGQGAPGGEGNQSNVSTIWHGGRLLSSGEVGFPYELSREDLSTIGAYTFGGALPSSFTAHPKIDPTTGRMHAFGYDFNTPYLRYYVVEPDGTMSHVEPIEIPRSTMIHDFQITATDVVFWDLPVVFDLDMAIEWIQDPSLPLPYLWSPEAGARIGVMPLAGGADQLQWFDIDPCYVFHSVNAFRTGDEVKVDVCRMDSMFAPEGEGIGGGGESALVRWTIDTAAGTATQEVLETEDPGDLPSRDPRRVGVEHRHGYLTGTRPNPTTVELGDVIKHDFTTGRREIWNPGPTRHASEPLFIPGDPSDTADDAGWLLSFVHDDAAGETVLAVLDATEVSKGPVAEVVMPQRVPYGFHATWVPYLTEQ